MSLTLLGIIEIKCKINAERDDENTQTELERERARERKMKGKSKIVGEFILLMLLLRLSPLRRRTNRDR